MNPTLRIAAALLLVAFLAPVALSACPLCADAKSDTDYPGGAASLPKGFYYSILFMVVAPFAVMGGFVWRVILTRRRVRALPSAESSPERSVSPLVPDPGGARP